MYNVADPAAIKVIRLKQGLFMYKVKRNCLGNCWFTSSMA